MITLYSLPIQIRHLRKYLFGKESFKIKIGKVSMYVRPRSYDPYIIGETFKEQVYKTRIFKSELKNVLDLGAYIGDFSIWAVVKLGATKVVGVEMNRDNYKLFKNNVLLNKLNKSILPMNVAIVNKKNKVKMAVNNFNYGMHKISEEGQVVVQGITLVELIERSDMEIVDFLKMDIEGAEKMVLTKQNEETFRNRIKYVIMETHPVEMSEQKVKEYFEKLGFRIKVRGQLFRRGKIFEASNLSL